MFETLEEKWGAIKQARDVALLESAWTQLPDAILTVAEREAWTAYREVLQGLEFAYSNPDDISCCSSSCNHSANSRAAYSADKTQGSSQ
jgi:hypothetical protein